MNGILVVDKPSGPTSHDICRHFKRSLPVKKVGHAGTLDPLATGVLVILLDQATKLQSIFLGQDKEYQFTMRLGIATDTYDSEGKRTRDYGLGTMDLGEREIIEKLTQLLPQFKGEILQTPPPFSAIKQNGRPLYKLARQGKAVEIAPRKIKIYSLEVVGVSLPDITMKMRCSCGTYVRSLAHDLGRLLKTGAHVTQLRRLRSEPFGVEEAIHLG